mgnify:CR=1 FL=1|jgi:hypothetical protein|tara:strand:+ start:2570 stop:2947 length:378 start_codon:yes stop_codon:yes gene_type:complete
MDKKTADIVRELINENLNLSDKGFKFELLNGSYDSNQITFKLRVQSNDAISVEEASLNQQNDWRKSLGKKTLSKEIICNIGGDSCKLVGFRPRARTKPYIIQNIESGKQYIISEAQAEFHFGIGS